MVWPTMTRLSRDLLWVLASPGCGIATETKKTKKLLQFPYLVCLAELTWYVSRWLYICVSRVSNSKRPVLVPHIGTHPQSDQHRPAHPCTIGRCFVMRVAVLCRWPQMRRCPKSFKEIIDSHASTRQKTWKKTEDSSVFWRSHFFFRSKLFSHKFVQHTSRWRCNLFILLKEFLEK